MSIWATTTLRTVADAVAAASSETRAARSARTTWTEVGQFALVQDAVAVAVGAREKALHPFGQIRYIDPAVFVIIEAHDPLAHSRSSIGSSRPAGKVASASAALTWPATTASVGIALKRDLVGLRDGNAKRLGVVAGDVIDGHAQLLIARGRAPRW